MVTLAANDLIYIADNNDNIQAADLSASSSIHHLENRLDDSSTLHCIINDEASDDRASKPHISSNYLFNSRRRFVSLEATTTDEQCKQCNFNSYTYVTTCI